MTLTILTEYAIITNTLIQSVWFYITVIRKKDTEVNDIKHYKFTDEEIEKMFKNED